MRIADLLERQHVPVHAHHALVGPDLLEFVPPAHDVAEVAEEDLFARSQVTDDVRHLVERVERTLRHAAQAEVDAVVGTGTDLDELPEPVEAAEDAVHAAVAGREPRVAGMAGHADLVLGRHGDHPFQEVGDAGPVHLGRHGFVVPRRPVLRLLQVPGAVDRTAPSGRIALGALVLHLAQVVFDRGDARFRGLAHHVADQFDFLVAFLVLAQHVIGHLAAVHVQVGDGQGHHLHFDPETGALLLLRRQFLHVPAVFPVEGDVELALVEDAVAGQVFQVFVRRAELLRADVHGILRVM